MTWRGLWERTRSMRRECAEGVEDGDGGFVLFGETFEAEGDGLLQGNGGAFVAA